MISSLASFYHNSEEIKYDTILQFSFKFNNMRHFLKKSRNYSYYHEKKCLILNTAYTKMIKHTHHRYDKDAFKKIFNIYPFIGHFLLQHINQVPERFTASNLIRNLDLHKHRPEHLWDELEQRL